MTWELGRIDFGHVAYPAVAAKQARDLAVAMAGATRRRTPTRTASRRRTRRRSSRCGSRTPLGRHRRRDDAHRPPAAARASVRHVPVDAAQPTFAAALRRGGELYIGIADPCATAERRRCCCSSPRAPRIPTSSRCRSRGRTSTAIAFVDLTTSAIVTDTTHGPPQLGHRRARASRGRDRRPPAARAVLAARRDRAQSEERVRRGLDPRAGGDRGPVRRPRQRAAHYEQPLPVGAIDPLASRPTSHRARRPTVQLVRWTTGRAPGDVRHARQRAASPQEPRAHRVGPRAARPPSASAQIFKAKCLLDATGVDVVVIPDIRELHPTDPFAPKAPANLLADIQSYLVAAHPDGRDGPRTQRAVRRGQVRLGVRFRRRHRRGLRAAPPPARI